MMRIFWLSIEVLLLISGIIAAISDTIVVLCVGRRCALSNVSLTIYDNIIRAQHYAAQYPHTKKGIFI